LSGPVEYPPRQHASARALEFSARGAPRVPPCPARRRGRGARSAARCPTHPPPISRGCRRQRPSSSGPARQRWSVGLHDIGLRGAAGGTATGQVVAVGKRLSDRLYVEYEQGITVATKLVRLAYALTRRLSLNAQTSQTTSSVGFTYRRSFD
jgi:hypothetical protein